MADAKQQHLSSVRDMPVGDEWTEEDLSDAALHSIRLAELEDEQQWDDLLSHTQDKLAEMAAKVRLDIQAGRVRSLESISAGEPSARRTIKP